MEPDQPPVLAIFPWGDVIEDYLSSIGLTLEQFASEMTGGWLFEYVKALQMNGVAPVIFVFSRDVPSITCIDHRDTGVPIRILPVPAVYRPVHRRMKNPHGTSVPTVFGEVPLWQTPVYAALRHLAPYLAFPWRSLQDALREERCRAILCQEYEYARFDCLVRLGRRLNIPVFATFQGGNYHFSGLERWIRPRTLALASGLIIAPGEERRRVQRRYHLPARKVVQIFNPIGVEHWSAGEGASVRVELKIPPASRVVVWHGRIDIQQKGLDILLDAWKELSGDLDASQFHLLLVGTGRDSTELRRRIAEMALSRIHWIDEFVLNRKRMSDLLHAGDLYVFPSRHEGFAVAPLEAMAAGLPVVAAEASGVSDIFAEGERQGGLVVPIEDAGRLADAMRRLLQNESLREEIGRRARERVEEAFSLEAVGRQLRQFIFQKP